MLAGASSIGMVLFMASGPTLEVALFVIISISLALVAPMYPAMCRYAFRSPNIWLQQSA
jgi:hypothetical protein